VKNKGLRLFNPEFGGSYAVFNNRPLNDDIKIYCVQDVKYLPRLYDHYRSQLSSSRLSEVKTETVKRLEESWSVRYDPKGRNRALAPAWRNQVATPIGNDLEDLDIWGEQDDDDDDYDDYQDTARDCMGWEEDMIKNGEWF